MVTRRTFFSPEYVLDIGTMNTLLVDQSKGVMFYEPTKMICDPQGNPLFFGEQATQIVSDDQVVVVPKLIEGGVLADEQAVSPFLRFVTSKIPKKLIHTALSYPVVFTVPVTFSRRDAFVWKRLATKVGIRPFFIPAVVGIAHAAPIVSKNNVEPKIVMDMGGGKIDFAVVEFGKVVQHQTTFLGGEHLLTRIQLYLFETRNLLITTNDAKGLLESVAGWGEKQAVQVVRGKDKKKGTIISAKISTNELHAPLHIWMRTLSDWCMHALASLPTKYAHTIERSGISLAGGLSQLPGIAQELQRTTGVQIRTIGRPQLAPALGAVTIIGSSEIEAFIT